MKDLPSDLAASQDDPALLAPGEPRSAGRAATRPDRADRRLLILGAMGLLGAMGVLAWTHRWSVDREFRSFRPAGVRINVNDADRDTLAMLDQIGPERAQKIVEWREEHGPFRSYPDLMQVAGIGQRTMEGLVGKIWFGP